MVGPSDVIITRNNVTSIKVSWTLLNPDESQGFVDNYTVFYQVYILINHELKQSAIMFILLCTNL